MAASVGSEEALIKTYELVGLEICMPGMSASLPYKPEEESESDKKFSSCQACRDQYEDDYKRDVWTPSIKLADQFVCTACQLKNWTSFKNSVKESISCTEEMKKNMASVRSEEALIKTYVQVGLEDFMPEMSASLPYKPEDEGESEENFSYCQTCKDQYEEDYKRDVWTPSIKLADQFVCTACQLKNWTSFKIFVEGSAEKNGFEIDMDKTESISCTEEMKKNMKLNEEKNASAKAEENSEETISSQADDDGTGAFDGFVVI